jgi:hypothetical protein
VRRRLHVLIETGHAQRFRYATSSEGSSPFYYKLTLQGLQIVHGKDAKPPTKGYLSEISVARHRHTRSLSDFLVHTFVATKKRNVTLTDFCGENSVRLAVGPEALFPDCCFRLVDPEGHPYNFLIECDNSTETVRSPKHLESWQRKVRLYERFQDMCGSRFRVLVLTTMSRKRLDHILEVALQEAQNPERLLFYSAFLPEYLSTPDAIAAPCFFDHHRSRVALVPSLPPIPLAPVHVPTVAEAASAFAPAPEFV